MLGDLGGAMIREAKKEDLQALLELYCYFTTQLIEHIIYNTNSIQIIFKYNFLYIQKLRFWDVLSASSVVSIFADSSSISLHQAGSFTLTRNTINAITISTATAPK